MTEGYIDYTLKSIMRCHELGLRETYMIKYFSLAELPHEGYPYPGTYWDDKLSFDNYLNGF